jgi:hypothetical protein
MSVDASRRVKMRLQLIKLYLFAKVALADAIGEKLTISLVHVGKNKTSPFFFSIFFFSPRDRKDYAPASLTHVLQSVLCSSVGPKAPKEACYEANLSVKIVISIFLAIM